MITPKPILDEINLRVRKIQDSPKYFTKRAALVEKALADLADVHSFWIEHPELRDRLLIEFGLATEKEIKELAKRGINKIKAAWNYLNQDRLRDSRVGVLGYMNPEVLKTVARMVEPGLNSAGFRRNYVKGFRHTVPSPSSVPSLVEDFCRRIKRSTDHPVEKAIETHMVLAGIQPFEEGNKRTARLFERRILESYGYPPAFIPYGERGVYLDLLQNAMLGNSSHSPEMQRPFYEYVSGKIATALDEIIEDLKI